jgi:hypothetical protein
MWSRSFAVRSATNTLTLLLLAACLHASTQAQDKEPTQEEVQTAVTQVRNDPLWAQKKKDNVLRFKPKQAEKRKPDEQPASKNVSEWINSASEIARYLVWGLGAACAAWVLVAMRRWARLRDQALPQAPDLLPSHISALDIRPQSLPPHIGETVLRLWREDLHRQALSLLYRGALSRLVHQHAIPIKAASTEEECIALTSARLDIEHATFVQQLITVWQRATYGSQLPNSDALEQLCQGFAHLLDGPTQKALP